ncbi:MAG: hypothetical protein ACREVL_13255 [Solimonas sp.]
MPNIKAQGLMLAVEAAVLAIPLAGFAVFALLAVPAMLAQGQSTDSPMFFYLLPMLACIAALFPLLVIGLLVADTLAGRRSRVGVVFHAALLTGLLVGAYIGFAGWLWLSLLWLLPLLVLGPHAAWMQRHLPADSPPTDLRVETHRG